MSAGRRPVGIEPGEYGTFTVTGEEKVKVAAGEFDTWKVEMSGTETPVTWWISKSNPRVVKIVPTGAPISIELVK